MSLTGNKGEWSEIYTLLKIISDRKLFAGDGKLNNIENLIFPIIKIIRDETEGTYSYSYDDDLVIITGSKEQFRMPISQFYEQSLFLFKAIKNSKTSTFAIPEIELFLSSFNCKSLKAKSSIKSDIRIVIHDQRTGTLPELGFSIKSQLGGASTLLNAGKTTNFVYKIIGANFSDMQMREINHIETRSKIKDRIDKIRSYSGRLEFSHTESSIFNDNLTLIDSSLSKILSEIILLYYTTGNTTLIDLVNSITENNPLDYNIESGHPYYFYKIKHFLTDVALGMMPSRVWTGELDATGGYLIVKENGDVLCYHIYNKNEFEDYLLNNTKLETASSSRHDFGSVYKSKDNQFFKLNLQIRFLK